MSKACIQCINRKLGCHDYCEDYLEYKKVIEKAKEGREEEFEYSDYVSNRLWKEKRA